MKNLFIIIISSIFSVAINHIQLSNEFLLQNLFKTLELNETYIGLSWQYYLYTFTIAFIFFASIFQIFKIFKIKPSQLSFFTFLALALFGMLLGIYFYSPKIDYFYEKFIGAWFYFFILPNIPGLIFLGMKKSKTSL